MKRGNIRNYSNVRRLVLDTGVLIEYIIEKSPYRVKVVRLFSLALHGEVELFVSPVTLSEVLYIASRIYQAAGVENPNREALDYVTWVTRRTKVVELSEDIVIRAGELKKMLHIALPDCYVIATAEAVGAIAVFRTIEKEMKPVLNMLRRLGVKFLEEIEV